MIGTASRFQTRLGYAPGLRVGQYPGAAAPVPMAPPPAGSTPPGAAPVTPSAPMASPASIAPGAAPPVMAGSMRPDERPFSGYQGGGAGESAQGTYGGPGPSGIGSTGSVLGDIAGFGRDAGLAASGLMGGPMGVVGTTFGALASGLAAALGYPETAATMARASGLPGVAPVGYTGAVAEGPGATVGQAVDIGAFGTPDLGEAPAGGYGTPGVSVKGDEFGAANMGYGPADDPSKGADIAYSGDYGGGDKGDNSGADGSSGEASGDSSGPDGGGDKGGDWMRGGYTGAGPDGVVQPNRIAGRVHEGEAVIPAPMVARYGLTPLMLLARGQVEPSRLSAMLRG